MADVFDEVEQQLKDEQYRRLFRRFAPFGAAIMAAVVLAVAGNEIVKSTRASAESAAADRFGLAEDRLEAKDYKAAEAAFADLAKTAPGGSKALAAMQAGAAALADGRETDAVAHFDAAAQMSQDPLISDLARLKAAYALADDLAFDALEARLEIVSGRDRPFQLAARELLASAALKAGLTERAEQDFGYISLAPDAPEGFRRRAEQALDLIAASKAPPPPPEEPAP